MATKVIDPFKPSAALLVKLGSIAVHVEEMMSEKGHYLDRSAIRTLLDDQELIEWRKAMDKLAMLPVKR
jgi:hypothetical protein